MTGRRSPSQSPGRLSASPPARSLAGSLAGHPARLFPTGPLVAFQLVPAALVQVHWQAHPDHRAAPVAIAADHGPILAASPTATGVVPGQTLAQARGRCPGLIVGLPDQRAATLLYEDLLTTLTTLSPSVEATRPADGLALLDAAGLAALWGTSPATWDGVPLARAALATLAERGIAARAGCGATRLVARLLCLHAAAGNVLSLPVSDADRYVPDLATTWGTHSGHIFGK